MIVSKHAADRLTERFPEIPERSAVACIVHDVQRALAEHRRAKRMPRWCAQRGRQYDTAAAVRYVWDETETRCYVIIRQDGRADRRDEFRETWFVKTTLPRLTEEQMQEAEQRRKALRRNDGRKRSRWR